MRNSATSFGIVAMVWLCFAARPIHSQTKWTVDASPITEIAPVSPSGEIQVDRTVGATRLSDGTIVLADARSSTIMFFNARGRHVLSRGGRGSGPGEFKSLWWMGQCGRDTVTAWDLANSRLTLIDAKGNVVREFASPVSPAVTGRAAHTTCSADGSIGLVSLPAQMNPRDPVQRSDATVTIVSAGGQVRTLGAGIRSGEFIVQGGGGMPRPLGHATTLALAGGRVYVGTGDSAAALMYSEAGQTPKAISFPLAASRPLRSGQYERATDDLLLLAPPRAADAMRRILLELPRPQRLPHYSALHTDRAGGLWVVQAAAGDPTRLLSIDATGRTIGMLEMPIPLQVWEVGQDYVLGQRYNADGEPFIVAYRFDRRPSSSK